MIDCNGKPVKLYDRIQNIFSGKEFQVCCLSMSGNTAMIVNENTQRFFARTLEAYRLINPREKRMELVRKTIVSELPTVKIAAVRSTQCQNKVI